MSENILKARLQQRTDTEANWQTANPVLLQGEIAISSDKYGMYKVGDGTSAWLELGYARAAGSATSDFSSYAIKSLSDNVGQQIDTTYIKSIVFDGTKVTITRGDGSTEEYNTVDTNTTYEVMQGATSTQAGKEGLVPAPGAGDANKFLAGDGSWKSASAGSVNPFTGATVESDGTAGTVPAPSTGEQNKFLKGDGTWGNPENTTYSPMVGSSQTSDGLSGLVPTPPASTTKLYLNNKGIFDVPEIEVMTGASSINNGKSGVVPAPSAGEQNKFLKADGTWAIPENTTYGAANSESAGILKLYSDTGSNTNGTMTQEAITAKLNSKAPTTHEHTAGDITSGKFALELLPESDVAAGSYSIVTVDKYGRVTAGANPTTLSGYGITDAAAKTHTHSIANITNLQTTLDGKANSDHEHDASDITSGILPVARLATSGVTAGTYRSVTVDKYGRVTSGTNPTTLSGYGITDAASKTHSHAISDITNLQTTLDGKSNTGHTHNSADINSLDASKLTGTISIDRLPKGALERCVVVSNDTARFALTSNEVQAGDTVKVTATSKMYFVVDASKLNSTDGYEEYLVGTAAAVAWSGVTGKPTTLSGYGITDAASKTHSHAISDITNLQTTLDGKAASSHNHSASNINSGTLDVARLATSGVTAGTYKSVTVDKYGRVTGGTNPTTLEGYGITDAASKTHSHAISDITNLQTTLDGKAANSHNHSAANITSGTLDVTRLATSGVTAGTYRSVTVDKYGRVTAGTNPTTLSGYGITDAASKTHSHAISDITDLQDTLDGKAASSHNHSAANITSGTLNAARLATSGVTAGTYRSVTVDKYGRVTAGTNPTTLSGYGITDAASKTHSHAISDITNLQTTLDGKSNTGHTHSYLPLSGGTLTGNITIKRSTSESNAYGSANPSVIFSNSDGTQLGALIFTDYDSIANPASLTFIGNTGGETFIAPVIKATGSIYEAGSKLADKYQAKGNYAGSSSNGGAATSAVKLSNKRSINGMNFDGSSAVTNYGTCSTAAATAAKVVSMSNFVLTTGATVKVKFTVTNTAASPTLNVNSTGAKAIYYRGVAISAGYLAANRTYEFVYNGTQWELVGDINTDTNTKATQTNTTTAADYRVILSTNANDTNETNTLRKSTNFRANPNTGAFFAKGYTKNDITDQTLDINTLNLSAGTPHKMEYIEKTSGGASNITNIPVTGQPFILTVECVRWASTTDYITKQTFQSSSDREKVYQRWCTNGTWTGWTALCTMGVMDFGNEG